MPVEIIDQKKKNTPEVLKITKRTRAKGIDDNELARIYEPGEEIRIAGSGKLTLLAMGKATRDLDYEIPVNGNGKKKSAKGKEEEKILVPKFANMKLDELDEYADLNLHINTKVFRTKPEKIAAIKAALNNVNN